MMSGPILAMGMVIALVLILGLERSQLLRFRRTDHRAMIALFLAVVLASCVSNPSSDLPKQRASFAASDARMVDHAMGTTAVPQRPQRVVTVDTSALDATIALGIKPVGSIVYAGFPEYLGTQTEGITAVGEGQPNFETILKLKPDLILGSKIGSEKNYEIFEQIAPTVLADGNGRAGDWQDTLQLFATALNKSNQADALLTDYQNRVSNLQKEVGDARQTTISIVASGQGRVGVYSSNSFPGSVLNDVGFSRPPFQMKQRLHGALVSREDLESIDGDIIFLVASSKKAVRSISRQEFMSTKIWANLKAVKTNHVYEVNDKVWIGGRNILAANQILDDVKQVFSNIKSL